MSDYTIIKLELEKQFELVCFEDLADYYSQHGAIFKLFKQYYQSEYQGNQRLVLYSSQAPSQDFLNHIQRVATKIDVSNFFILIATPFELESNLIEANTLYGNDSQPMQSLRVNIAETKPFGNPGFFKQLDTICPLPFTAIDISTTGTARPCCKFRTPLGNIQDTPVQNIFNSDYFKSVRQKLTDGERITDCQICWDNEKHNITSLRQHALAKFSEKFEQEWFDQPTLSSVNLSFSNLCNFSCRICDYKSSSTIAVEEFTNSVGPEQKKFFKQYLNLDRANKDKKILDNVANNLEKVESLHIMGGEPFIWPMLPEFLDHIIDRDLAKNMSLEFNSNCSTFPNKLLDRLHKFKAVEILLSIDDIGKRFEVQRGGQWDDIVNNLNLYNSIKSPNIIVKVAPTVNIQNVLYLPEIVSFYEQNHFDIVWWYLEHPHYLSIEYTTAQAKELIYQKLQAHPLAELRSIAQRVITSRAVGGQEFLKYTAKLDQRRGQQFEFSHKEIFDAMSH